MVTLALALNGCFVTDTEGVTEKDAVALCARRLVHDDRMAQEQKVYTWDEARKGHMDAEETELIRFGHLQADAYLAQVQALRVEDSEGRMAPAGSSAFVLALIRVAPARLFVLSADCHEADIPQDWLARGYGIEMDPRRNALRGNREGIIGFLTATLDCEPMVLDDLLLVPEAISPGGAELAPQGTKYDRGRFVPHFSRACDGGDTESCYKLGQIYQRGEGVASDPAQAAQLFEKVCAAREMRGCLDLALLYDRGEGVTRDPARALQLLQQACDGGEMYACEVLKSRRPPADRKR
jgi:hypothetical protein